MPTAKWHEKFGIYKTKSDKLRMAIIKKLQNAARVRGATGEAINPIPTNKKNIEDFGGSAGVTKASK